jgi:hypothetical protein
MGESPPELSSCINRPPSNQLTRDRCLRAVLGEYAELALGLRIGRDLNRHEALGEGSVFVTREHDRGEIGQARECTTVRARILTQSPAAAGSARQSGVNHPGGGSGVLCVSRAQLA